MFASGKTAAVASAANYIEEVFSTYLYTGNGSSQTITNGIDLSTKGGLVWLKGRSGSARPHCLFDTARTDDSQLSTNSTAAASTGWASYFDFSTTGFGFPLTDGDHNANNETFASWTFRKQPKFFDIVTFSTTTSSTVPITVNHNLGSVPGCIIVKQTNGAADWFVYHRSRGSTKYLTLNSTDAEQNGGTSKWYATPTSTAFTLGGDFVQNATYVAYLFAHDAGGFGLTGTDNVISCGSYTGNGAAGGQLINLGYEAQWVMIKNVSFAADWWMLDTMRGWVVNGDFGSDQALFANSSATEQGQVAGQPDALGFRPIQDNVNQSGQTYIYIAIRRGPMKVPTSGTSVFAPVVSSVADGTQITAGFPVDMQMFRYRAGTVSTYAVDRLRGVGTTTTAASTPRLLTNATTAETNTTGIAVNWNNTGFAMPTGFGGVSDVFWNFQRAPSFFDEVCYTGTGTAGQTYTHNLGVAPELMIVKSRNATGQWPVYSAALGNTNVLLLNLTDAQSTNSTIWNNTSPTASVFTVGTYSGVNTSGNTYVAYLFATCAGVSKVGSYTGTGTTLQVNCGFTGGARFVLIKRTDSTGDWYVWDSARGIVSGNDPYLLLNSTAAEVTNTDYIDTYSAGFEISSTAPAAINASGGTFIFLAIA